MSGTSTLIGSLRRLLCRHRFVQYLGSPDDDYVCLRCGKPLVIDHA